MMGSPILISVNEGVAHLHFNRPERMNVLDAETAEAFGAGVSDLLSAGTARVLVMTGEGRNFMAGGDLVGFRDSADKPAFIARTIDPLHGALLALARSDVVTIAAAHGRVAGAGVSLVAGADLALAAEGASFTLAYCRIAGVPDCGGSWSLPRAVGLKAAMEMALANTPVEAEEAQRLGLINRVVPADQLASEALALARRIADGPGEAQARTKRLLRQSFETGYEAQLDAEKAAFVACASHPDFTEGVEAFLERRTPRFNG